MWRNDYSGGRGLPNQGSYDVAQICLNGHVITSIAHSAPELKKPHCPTCGEPTITKCPNPDCNQAIKGHYSIPGIVDFSSYQTSAYCDSCGQPYPWTKKSQEAVAELIEFSEMLSIAEKEDFKGSIKDLMIPTPRTTLAVTKYKVYIKKAGTEVAKGLKDILIDVVSETVKKAIWG